MLLGTEGKGGKGYRRYPPSSDVKGKLSPSWTEKVFFRVPHLRRTKPTIFLLKSILIQQHSIYVFFFFSVWSSPTQMEDLFFTSEIKLSL